MVRIHGATVIDRPVEEVFDYVADERNEPAYNPAMVRAQQVTHGPVGVGTCWATTVLVRGEPQDMLVEVTDYERPARLGSWTTLPTGEVRGALRFEPAGTGTKMSWDWDVKPRGALKLLAPLVAVSGARQERRIWGSLKRRLESGRAG